MKPLQIMRAVLNALQQPTLFGKGVAMQRRSLPEGANGAISAAPPSLAAFKRAHGAAFVDVTGHLNLAVHLSRSAIAEVGVLLDTFCALWMSQSELGEMAPCCFVLVAVIFFQVSTGKDCCSSM